MTSRSAPRAEMAAVPKHRNMPRHQEDDPPGLPVIAAPDLGLLRARSHPSLLAGRVLQRLGEPLPDVLLITDRPHDGGLGRAHNTLWTCRPSRGCVAACRVRPHAPHLLLCAAVLGAVDCSAHHSAQLHDRHAESGRWRLGCAQCLAGQRRGSAVGGLARPGGGRSLAGCHRIGHDIFLSRAKWCRVVIAAVA